MSMIFPPSTPLILGLELELQIVDAVSGTLSPSRMALWPVLQARPVAGQYALESTLSTMEINSSVHGDADAMSREVLVLVRQLREVASAVGWMCAAAAHSSPSSGTNGCSRRPRGPGSWKSTSVSCRNASRLTGCMSTPACQVVMKRCGSVPCRSHWWWCSSRCPRHRRSCNCTTRGVAPRGRSSRWSIHTAAPRHARRAGLNSRN